LTGGVWKDLYTCHWIDELYNYWLNELLLKHKSELDKLAPEGYWQEEKTISQFFPLIAGYDRTTSYFRYPVTNSSQLDAKKYTMQRLDLEKLPKLLSGEEKKQDEHGGKVILLLKNDNDEIVDGFERAENILENVTEALKKVSYHFYCVHIMTRITLCG